MIISPHVVKWRFTEQKTKQRFCTMRHCLVAAFFQVATSSFRPKNEPSQWFNSTANVGDVQEYDPIRIQARNRDQTLGCVHNWKHNAKIGCGQHGCGFAVTSSQNVRGVKKVFMESVTRMYPHDFHSSLEVFERLNGKCPAIQSVVDLCERNEAKPFFVFSWKGHDSVQSYYIDQKRPIPLSQLSSWLYDSEKIFIISDFW